MAKRITYALDDDLDGTPADETVPFELDGTAYTIDLSKTHAEELREALDPFVQGASTVPQQETARVVPSWSTRRGRPSRPTSRPTSSPDQGPPDAAQRKAVNTAIRDWARGAGYEVGDRGRINKTVVEAYHQAKAGQGSSPQR
ncbi:Lsr2 family protein [Dactylosporangium sp. NPDC051485]|uniref:histone-like nucleoid-structuring protein Lsr2 n=1 Tax=Dactylosporangium sp. NPDC051485 TaxID=3154846 RepID=UPI00341B9699